MAVITDSGGVSEETTLLGIPCLTLRNETERPETVSLGTNQLIGDDLDIVPTILDQISRKIWKKGSPPPLWDGHSGDRIVQVLDELGYLT